MSLAPPNRPRSTLLAILLLWLAFYGSIALFTPPLLDDADSVHAEVAREMLLRHDYVTLYANGIRYMEKAPLFYWSMALSMKLSMLLGGRSATALAAAARCPLALSMLALALLVEALARRTLRSVRASLYAALIVLSSFGMFLFTRMLIPDAEVCLWTMLAVYALWRCEEIEGEPKSAMPQVRIFGRRWDQQRSFCYLFALACALNVLTKGLIGVVFPVATAVLYFVATRGLKGTLRRVRELHPLSSLAVFLAVAVPWHLLAGLANPGQGHPAPFLYAGGHWQVPLPSDGNVRGWFWFYFMNEHLLRYLNLRVPHDYDTAPLWVFWGLCLLWLLPFSVFVFNAVYKAAPFRSAPWRGDCRALRLGLTERARLLLLIAAAFVLLFFALSSRQEYYVLPALPALAILIASWIDVDAHLARQRRAMMRGIMVALGLGTIVFLGSTMFLVRSHAAAPGTDLASLLSQNPDDYALSLGHFMDLTGPSVVLFRIPLMIAALSMFLGPLLALEMHIRKRSHAANLALAAGAFGFLISVFLGLRIFSPVLTSAQLAEAIAPQLRADDLVCIHGEYESGSTLGFYLKRNDIHILEGRSSNLWYGSFFADAPKIFETPASIAQKWAGRQRIFMWQSLADPPNTLPTLPGPVYILMKKRVARRSSATSRTSKLGAGFYALSRR